jgi:hypothetical protein
MNTKNYLQITNKLPTNQKDANAQISRPRMCLGMNSEKYDHTIGTLPPTLLNFKHHYYLKTFILKENLNQLMMQITNKSLECKSL